MTPNEIRAAVLHLYRNCLRSARRIPTQEQREIWLAYTRGKFKENRRITDVRLKRAFQDGQEQLSRMNYFHDVRNRQIGSPHGGNGGPRRHPRQGAGGAAAPASSGGEHAPLPAGSSPEASWSLKAFLETHLPGVSREELRQYQRCLEADGFGSAGMLKFLREEDLGGWKTAHRRAMLDALSRLRKGKGERGEDTGVGDTGRAP